MIDRMMYVPGSDMSVPDSDMSVAENNIPQLANQTCSAMPATLTGPIRAHGGRVLWVNGGRDLRGQVARGLERLGFILGLSYFFNSDTPI